MVHIVSQTRDPETAANSLLLVPLWHLLAHCLQKPFKMNTFENEQYRHNSENPVWWGLPTRRIRFLVENNLKPILADLPHDTR